MPSDNTNVKGLHKIRRKIMEKDMLCRLLPKDKHQAWIKRIKCAGIISGNGDLGCRLIRQERVSRVKLMGLASSRKRVEQAGDGLC